MKMQVLIAGAVLTLGASGALAGSVAIPNADFETLYKPGTGETVTGHIANGWTDSMSTGAHMSCCGTGAIVWSDGTTGNQGDAVEVPGWTTVSGASGVQSAIGEGGSQGVWINGDGFGSNGSLINSDNTVTTINANQSYTLSMRVSDNNSGVATIPLFLTLLDKNGNAITPTSSSFPTVTPAYQTASVTYSAAALLPYVNQGVFIQFGAGANGNQTDVDNISLTSTPEPSALALAGVGALGLLRRRR